MAFSCGKLLWRFWLGAYRAWKLQGKEEGCPLTGGCPHWAPGPLSSAGRSSTTRARRRMTGPKEAPRGTQGRASMEAAFRVGPEGAPLQQLGSDTDPKRHEVLRASKDYNMGGLEPQKFIVAQFWRPKSSCGQATRPRKVLGKEIFQTSLLVASSIPSLADGGLPLTVSLQAVFSLYLSVSGSKLLPSIRTAALLFFFFF